MLIQRERYTLGTDTSHYSKMQAHPSPTGKFLFSEALFPIDIPFRDTCRPLQVHWMDKSDGRFQKIKIKEFPNATCLHSPGLLAISVLSVRRRGGSLIETKTPDWTLMTKLA